MQVTRSRLLDGYRAQYRRRLCVSRAVPSLFRRVRQGKLRRCLNSVNVQFSNGLLTIHSTGATLSEVLFQIQKQTGAEIAIPSGTEQDRVAADFGPGSPSEVLGALLNGSGLNFVVVGSEVDPHVLRSVILSRK